MASIFNVGDAVETRRPTNKHFGTVQSIALDKIEIKHRKDCCESPGHCIWTVMLIVDAEREWKLHVKTAWQKLRTGVPY